MWATLASRAPVVATFHSGATRSRLFDLAAPVLRRVARRLAVRIAVSRKPRPRSSVHRIGGSFEIVPNGVDVARFATADPGRPRRGDEAPLRGPARRAQGLPDGRRGLRAARRRTGPTCGSSSWATGPTAPRPTRSLPEIRDRITFLGSVPNRDLPPIHAACDLYLGTSVGGESFGIVLVEALAAGLPVVASDIPGYDEVVRDGVDGLLVPPRDPEALAAAAARVLDDPALAAPSPRRGGTAPRPSTGAS